MSAESQPQRVTRIMVHILQYRCHEQSHYANNAEWRPYHTTCSSWLTAGLCVTFNLRPTPLDAAGVLFYVLLYFVRATPCCSCKWCFPQCLLYCCCIIAINDDCGKAHTKRRSIACRSPPSITICDT